MSRRLGVNVPRYTLDLGDLSGVKKCVRYPRKGRSDVECQHEGTFIANVGRSNHYGEKICRWFRRERRKSTPLNFFSSPFSC